MGVRTVRGQFRGRFQSKVESLHTLLGSSVAATLLGSLVAAFAAAGGFNISRSTATRRASDAGLLVELCFAELAHGKGVFGNELLNGRLLCQMREEHHQTTMFVTPIRVRLFLVDRGTGTGASIRLKRIRVFISCHIAVAEGLEIEWKQCIYIGERDACLQKRSNLTKETRAYTMNQSKRSDLDQLRREIFKECFLQSTRLHINKLHLFLR
mmetsp:Transcript_359/g.1042  ORF Transcript_359/g.1042 Transcript_359/m.1042 type:complete len:211 (+) Transcript_359:152-784(+)